MKSLTVTIEISVPANIQAENLTLVEVMAFVNSGKHVKSLTVEEKLDLTKLVISNSLI